MFVKIVFLFITAAVLANNLKVTPDELKEFYDEINTTVRDLEQPAMLEIAGNIIQLDTVIIDAKRLLETNLTEAATPYWDTIKSLEDAAAATGQNITRCIDSATNKLYELNTTVLYQAFQAFEYYNYSGNRMINSSKTEAYSVILEVAALGDVILTCKDDTCATEVNATISEYYQRVLTTLYNAKTKVSNFVNEYLPRLVTLYPFNTNMYEYNVNNILSDVNYCINNTLY